MGFIQTKHDYSLFTRLLDGHFLAILVYVDDIVLIGTSMPPIDYVKHSLDQAFTIKDLGALNYFLGVEISRSSNMS